MEEIRNVEIELISGGAYPTVHRSPPGLPNPEPTPAPVFPPIPQPYPSGPNPWGD
jgi:hypothetical protein